MTEAAMEARRAAKRAWYAEHREERRAYAREWRKRNPERVAEHQRRFWEKKAAEHEQS